MSMLYESYENLPISLNERMKSLQSIQFVLKKLTKKKASKEEIEALRKDEQKLRKQIEMLIKENHQELLEAIKQKTQMIANKNSKEMIPLKLLKKILFSTSCLKKIVVYKGIYIPLEEVSDFQILLIQTKIFEFMNSNEYFIYSLEKYLEKLERRLNLYKKVSGIPLAKAKNGIIILKSDEREYNNILEIIELLQKKEDLVDVKKLAKVSKNDVTKFLRLANATRYFHDQIRNEKENQLEEEKIKERIIELIRKAQKSKEEKVMNQTILLCDLEEVQLLDEKYQLLEDAKASDNKEFIEGCFIDKKYRSRFIEINQRLSSISASEVEVKRVA